MSKRRLQSSDDEKEPEELTAEERKALRRRERAQAKSGKGQRGFGSPLRRGLLLGLPIALIAVIIAFLLFNPFGIASPCLTLSTPNGPPYYPPAGTTNFNGTWCPAAAGNNLIDEPRISIQINGSEVPLSNGIGVNSTYTSAHYTCTLPVSTPTTAGTLPEGVFVIASPWLFSYNLSWFFQAWAATTPTIAVGSSPSQPVEYTANDLLGYTTSSTKHITLFVDGEPSSAGPSLVLPTLPYLSSPTPTPGCISSVYGTGHTIVLTYTVGAATVGTAGTKGAEDLTGPGDPQYAPQLFAGPIPRMTPDVMLLLGLGPHASATLSFAAMRVFPLA